MSATPIIDDGRPCGHSSPATFPDRPFRLPVKFNKLVSEHFQPMLEKARREASGRPDDHPLIRPHHQHSEFASSRKPYIVRFPWPGHFDPPTFPDLPGSHSPEIRRAWRAYINAHELIADPLGLECSVEVGAGIYALVAALDRADVVFDINYLVRLRQWLWTCADRDGDGDTEDPDHGN